MFSVELKQSIITDLKLAKEELQKASKEAIRVSSNKLRSLGSKEVQSETGLKAASANKRVKVFKSSEGSKVWFGARTLTATATSFKDVKLKAPNRKNKGKGHAIIIDNKPLPNAFVRRTSSRYRNTPFKRTPSGSLEVVRRAISGDVYKAFLKVDAVAPEIIDADFRRAVEGQIRRRS